MIRLFESASDEQFSGKVYVDGVLTEDDAVKKNTEIHITEESRDNSSRNRERWYGICCELHTNESNILYFVLLSLKGFE